MQVRYRELKRWFRKSLFVLQIGATTNLKHKTFTTWRDADLIDIQTADRGEPITQAILERVKYIDILAQDIELHRLMAECKQKTVDAMAVPNHMQSAEEFSKWVNNDEE
jgi:hypothetical protein